jgi:hypothetical protein
LCFCELINFNLFIHRVDDNLHVVKDEPNSYPRKIAYNWKNVNRIKIDTAFQTEGVTYFFDDKVFYQFNDQRMSLMIKKPQVSSIRWMNCRLTEEQITDIQKSARTQEMETSSAPTTSPKTSVFSYFLIFVAILRLFY